MAEHLKSEQDVEAILTLALQNSGAEGEAALRQRLIASAAELGLSAEAVLVAERQYAEIQRAEAERALLEKYRHHRRSSFLTHAISYLAVNGCVFALSQTVMTSLQSLVLLSVFGWGIGLLIHGGVAFLTRPSITDEGFQQWLKEHQKSQKKLDAVLNGNKPS